MKATYAKIVSATLAFAGVVYGSHVFDGGEQVRISGLFIITASVAIGILSLSEIDHHFPK